MESDSCLVEMLISNDCYFDLLLPRKIDLRPGVCLFQSRLGWILGRHCHTSSDTSEEPTLLVSTLGIPPMGVRSSMHMLTNVDSLYNLDRF